MMRLMKVMLMVGEGEMTIKVNDEMMMKERTERGVVWMYEGGGYGHTAAPAARFARNMATRNVSTALLTGSRPSPVPPS
jgi:hypothetical protein